MKKVVILLVVAALFLGGCSGMSNTQQRTLSGGAIGAGTGGGVTKTATVSLTVTSSGGGVGTLSNGVAVTISGAASAWVKYKITVPASQTSLNCHQ